MILYFADRHLNILGQASTRLPGGGTVVKDRKTDDIETGVSIFECDILFDKKTRSNIETWTETGNYVLRSSKGENEFYNITDAEIDTKKQKVRIYAEDDGLDLINEIADSYEADQYYPIATYIEHFAAGSGWEIGINEIEGLTRKLNLDGDKTVSAMLLDIAEGFNNAEISYSFEINGLQIVKKYINIYEKRGKDTGIQLRLNKEIDSIITTKTITNLATALKCKGATPDNSEEPITFQDFDYFDYDDGDFYIDGAVLKSRKALDKWSRFFYKGQSGGHIVKQFSFDTTSPDILCEKAIEELKKICDTEINYEVDFAKFPDNVKVGDRVNIIDDNGNLYLSSRILTLETSDCDETHRAILGEHFIKESGISQTVSDLAQQFSELANKRNFFTWIAYADDIHGKGISLNPEGKYYLGIATNKKVNVVDISDPSVFTWSKIKGEPGTPGKDAEDANSIVKLCPEYYLSDSSTAQTGGSWSENLPEWVSGSYIWERQRVEWSDNSISYSDPVLCTALNHAEEAAAYATQQAATATEKAEQAEEHASNANAAAAEAQTKAEESKTAVDKANEDIITIKNDIKTAFDDIESANGELNTLKETMSTDYYKKTELTEIHADFQTQISQNATQIESTAQSIIDIQVDTEEAQKNADEAKTKADAAQSAANTAIADAEAAMNAANVADKAAKDAQAVASAAENDLEEAKANLEVITGRVDATEEDIAAAQNAVQQAQTKADEAKANAESAQSAADEAKTNANNAKSAADNAQADADKALEDLSKLGDRVTKAETSITQNSEQILLRATKAEVSETVNNIKVGGRNLAEKTYEEWKDTNVSQWSGGIGYYVNGSDRWGKLVSFEEIGLNVGDNFTIGIDLNAINKTIKLRVDLYRGSTLGENYNSYGTEAVEIGTSKRVFYTKTVTEEFPYFAIYVGNNDTTDATTTVEQYKCLKIEKGNKATDWTLAPEDMATAEEVENAQSTAEKASSKADTNSEKITITESAIKQLSDSISMLVTDESGSSLMTQTENGWTFSTKQIQDTVNSISENLNTLVEEQGSTKATVDVLDQAIKDLEKTADYVRISSFENEPCIELGESDSDYSLMITNTRILFRVGSNTPTLINADGLVTQNIEVENELRQGGFIQIAYSGWGLLWKGSVS